MALVVGQPDGILELLSRVVTVAADRTVRFRLLESGSLETAGHDRLIGSGFQSGEGSLHILGRPIDPEHPIPIVDPGRLTLAEAPQPIVEPLEF